MSTDKPDVYIDEKAVAAVDAKIRETQAMTSGLMSSWARPLEGLTKGPAGDITPPKKIDFNEGVTTKVLGGVYFQPGVIIKIPAQAMKPFKRILELCDSLEVRLNEEQKKMFLESLQAVPTPKNIMDAKAIFELIEALQK